MERKSRKILLLAGKAVIAAVLLTWVLGQVHFRDYVVAADGESYSVLAVNDDGFTVAGGAFWWRREAQRPRADFKPIPNSEKLVRQGFVSTIRTLNKAMLACAVVGLGISLLIIAARWWMLLRIQDVRISLPEAVRLTFVGQFFNAVVPGTIGGDLVKGYYVARHTPRKAAVLVSIFVDRVMGMTGLGLLSAVMLAVALAGGLADASQLRRPVVAVAVVGVIVPVVLAFLLSSRIRRLLHLERFYRHLPLAHHVAAAGDAARLYRRRIGALGQAVMITFVAQIFWIGSIVLVGKSLSLSTPWYTYFLYIPLIYIFGAVPLTPGGVGLIEKLYVVFFTAVSPSAVLAMALLARLVPMFWGLPGAIFAVAGPKLPKAEIIQAELGLDQTPDNARRDSS
ncbi:MAG: lysylphosphatidylglycerol synthase transmembrane domain-containing protein [Planctomycetota bacterium]|nr:lysylphosphatidylglycerol synthase transmembrane domain-containing protein [Planctomycetota bacterium]